MVLIKKNGKFIKIIKFGVLEYMITLIKFSIKKIISWTKKKKKKFEPLKSFPGHKVATTPKP